MVAVHVLHFRENSKEKTENHFPNKWRRKKTSRKIQWSFYIACIFFYLKLPSPSATCSRYLLLIKLWLFCCCCTPILCSSHMCLLPNGIIYCFFYYFRYFKQKMEITLKKKILFPLNLNINNKKYWFSHVVLHLNGWFGCLNYVLLVVSIDTFPRENNMKWVRIRTTLGLIIYGYVQWIPVLITKKVVVESIRSWCIRVRNA